VQRLIEDTAPWILILMVLSRSASIQILAFGGRWLSSAGCGGDATCPEGVGEAGLLLSLSERCRIRRETNPRLSFPSPLPFNGLEDMATSRQLRGIPSSGFS